MNEYFKDKYNIYKVQDNKDYWYDYDLKHWRLSRHIAKESILEAYLTQLTLLDILMMGIPE